MYTYKDLEQLTGANIRMLRHYQHLGILNGDSSSYPTTFSEVDAYRAAWIAMLVRAHMTIEEANALFAPAIRNAIKDFSVVMLLTHEGPKFFNEAPSTLWDFVIREGAVFHVISVGPFFFEVRKELKAIQKVRKFRSSLRLDEIETELSSAVH
jgi:hypothetical protein